MTQPLKQPSLKFGTETLVALYLLLEKRNLSAVARELGLSQPALSHILAKMRDVFGDDLLIREGNRMAPTERGLAVLAQLAVVLPKLESLFAPPAFNPAESKQHFRLALADHAGQVLAPLLLRRLCQEAPNVVTHFAVTPNRPTQDSELDARKFDIRIGWLRSLPMHWRKRKLCGDHIVVIGAPGHPDLADNGRHLTIERFAQLRFIGLEGERPTYRNPIDTHLAAMGVTRNILARASHFSIVPFMIAESDLVAMFPQRLALAFQERNLVSMAPPPISFPDNDLTLAWHPRVHTDPGNVWLRRMIVECAHELVGQD